MSKSILFRHIKSLVGIQPPGIHLLRGQALGEMHSIDDAYLLVEGDKISSFGPESECRIERADEIVDCTGRLVLPSFCDSHTHIVFAAWREGEFVDRINGLSYEEIARRGGGILNSAAKLQEMSEDDLYEQAYARLIQVAQMGTGAIEIKSGYGLTADSEIKMLRVIRRLREQHLVPIKATFLGAHAMPTDFKSNRSGYIKLLLETMLPQIADEGLADYIDVFCDKGFYTPEETDQILNAGLKAGLKAKIHANELDYSGGIQVGVKYGAVSVDHLEYTGEAEIQALAGADTVATILPSTSFFLGIRYAPARYMIENNLPVALGSDYNPGTSPSGNMSFILSLASIKLKMRPEEALNAVTVNGAAAMELQATHGSITPSKSASLILSQKIPGLDYLPYSYSSPWIERVLLQGHWV